MSSPAGISEYDLHAFVDGELDFDTRAVVQAWLDEHPNDAARVRYAFRLCVARPPTARESQILLALLSESQTWYAAHAADAKALVGAHNTKSASIEAVS